MLNLDVKNKILTLIGSTLFKREFQTLCENLSLEGAILLAPSIFSGYDTSIKLDEEELKNLIDATKKKIEMSDLIIVINYDSYIGDGTYDDIKYALELNKPVLLFYKYQKSDDFIINEENYIIGLKECK